MDKKKRLLHQLDTPYSTVTWPKVSLEDQDTILELLCSLLSPLGQHRAQYGSNSKGRRDKKRKRKRRGADADADADANANANAKVTSALPPPLPLPTPPAPALRAYVDVGLSSVTRSLQESAATQAQQREQRRRVVESPKGGTDQEPPAQTTTPTFYSVIFAARSGRPNVLNSHLPQMVAVASRAHPERTPVRLVGLSKACEERLAQSLGIPRVSCIGLRADAPNSKPLVDFTRERVPVCEIPWLEEARQPEYRAVKINAIETTVGAKKQRVQGS